MSEHQRTKEYAWGRSRLNQEDFGFQKYTVCDRCKREKPYGDNIQEKLECLTWIHYGLEGKDICPDCLIPGDEVEGAQRGIQKELNAQNNVIKNLQMKQRAIQEALEHAYVNRGVVLCFKEKG